jgi:8-hydroxy-5-deazaflavin:NADPH oxidoreductase
MITAATTIRKHTAFNQEQIMNVTIIGTGSMARGIATRLLAGGNSVTLVGHTPEKADELTAELRGAATNGAVVTTTPLGSDIATDIVILAVKHKVALSLAQQYGSKFAGKTLVDISNPMNTTFDALATVPGTSVAEEIAKIAAGARVVKAFNTNFASTLVAGEVDGQSLDVFIAGDDADAKNSLAQLITAGGLRPVDVGPLSRAQQLEGLGLLHITLQFTLGTNFASGVKIVA